MYFFKFLLFFVCHFRDKDFCHKDTRLILRSPVGILNPRTGGFPMKTIFFVAPYDLIDIRSKNTLPFTVDSK